MGNSKALLRRRVNIRKLLDYNVKDGDLIKKLYIYQSMYIYMFACVFTQPFLMNRKRRKFDF